MQLVTEELLVQEGLVTLERYGDSAHVVLGPVAKDVNGRYLVLYPVCWYLCGHGVCPYLLCEHECEFVCVYLSEYQRFVVLTLVVHTVTSVGHGVLGHEFRSTVNSVRNDACR